jgi:hypothetical protein
VKLQQPPTGGWRAWIGCTAAARLRAAVLRSKSQSGHPRAKRRMVRGRPRPFLSLQELVD